MCKCGDKLEIRINLKSPHPYQPLRQDYLIERREENSKEVSRLADKDRILVTPPNLVLFVVLVKL